jgi:hypothetical protein
MSPKRDSEISHKIPRKGGVMFAFYRRPKMCRKHSWQDAVANVQVIPDFRPGAINTIYPRPIKISICRNCEKIKRR